MAHFIAQLFFFSWLLFSASVSGKRVSAWSEAAARPFVRHLAAFAAPSGGANVGRGPFLEGIGRAERLSRGVIISFGGSKPSFGGSKSSFGLSKPLFGDSKPKTYRYLSERDAGLPLRFWPPVCENRLP